VPGRSAAKSGPQFLPALSIRPGSNQRVTPELFELTDSGECDFALAVIDAWAETDELPPGISELAGALR
jgi:hypothetical protein